MGVPPIPADIRVLTAYITKMADEGSKPSSIQSAVAAIKYFTEEANSRLDTDNKVFKNVMEGIRRKLGTKQTQSEAITPDNLSEMVRVISDNEITNIRMKAMLLLGFSAALRRTELLNIKADDVTFHPEGIELYISKSKTDQTGNGHTLYINYAQNESVCPVMAVHNWFNYSGIESGYLFQSTTINGELSEQPLSENAFYVQFKNVVRNAGLEGKVTPHSLRAGFCTSASENGVGIEKIAKHARHAKLETTARYIRPTNAFENASKGLL